MTNKPSVSLIIVSRNRPTALRRVLASLRFQTYPDFEVIVVSDAPDGSFLSAVPKGDLVQHITYSEPNISAARNIGLRHASGEIVAFCDDDAIPYPYWLERLVQPFAIEKVASAGGYVRARNGIGYQWKAQLCDVCGEDRPLDLDESQPFTVVAPDNGSFAKIQGTNCAFRRTPLLEYGGFDEDFRFFLDETDVCCRLAQKGFSSAFVPTAQVHHGFEASDQRSESRVPHTLFDIGASKARFLKKHGGEVCGTVLPRFIEEQNARLIGLMVGGQIEPRDVTRLLASLKRGLSSAVEPVNHAPLKSESTSFKAFSSGAPKSTVALGGSQLSHRRLVEKATHLSAKNIPVVVFEFSITSLFHRRFFDERGFWMQTGGLFGKSSRNDPVFRFETLRSRTQKEVGTMSEQFPNPEIKLVKMFRNFVLEKTKSANTN